MKRGKPGTEDFNSKVLNELFDDVPSPKLILVPFLHILKDGQDHSAAEIRQKLIEHFKLNDEQLKIKSGREEKFGINIRNTRFNLKKKQFIDEVGQFIYRITEHGLNFMAESPDNSKEEINEIDMDTDPFSVIQEKYQELRSELGKQIIKKIMQSPPEILESIVVKLLTAMGYGDGSVTGNVNDEGIDGIIKEDKLGLDVIYMQAKRYQEGNNISRDQVQSFSGALDGKGAKKGVYITTSKFTRYAEEYANKLESKKIILIDGTRLAHLMINYNIGVRDKETFVIKELDYSYFNSDE